MCPCKACKHTFLCPNWHAKNPSSWEALCEPQRNPGHLDIIAISCHHHQIALSAPHYNIPPFLFISQGLLPLSVPSWLRWKKKDFRQARRIFEVWLLVCEPTAFECKILHNALHASYALSSLRTGGIIVPVCVKTYWFPLSHLAFRTWHISSSSLIQESLSLSAFQSKSFDSSPSSQFFMELCISKSSLSYSEAHRGPSLRMRLPIWGYLVSAGLCSSPIQVVLNCTRGHKSQHDRILWSR